MRDGRPSWTARWVATRRAALAGSRPVHGDADAEGRLYAGLAMPMLGSRLLAPARMGARTEFFDRQAVDAAARGVNQVVVLGAGYDGRALRFSEFPIHWIEVDHPASQADKRRRLAEIGAEAVSGKLSFAPVDLIAGDLGAALDASGHDPVDRTLWMAEGLLPYLPDTTIASLFETLGARSATGSMLAVNVLVHGESSPVRDSVRSVVDKILAAMGEPRLSRFVEGDIERLLADAGWRIEERSRQAESRADGSHFLAILAVR